MNCYVHFRDQLAVLRDTGYANPDVCQFLGICQRETVTLMHMETCTAMLISLNLGQWEVESAIGVLF